MCLLVVKMFYVLLSALICKQMAVTERYIRFGPKTWNCGCHSNQDQNQLINHRYFSNTNQTLGARLFSCIRERESFLMAMLHFDCQLCQGYVNNFLSPNPKAFKCSYCTSKRSKECRFNLLSRLFSFFLVTQ